jgi:hypothetical protein
MRLAELLGTEVVGPDGEPLGRVLEVLAVQSGPRLGVDHSLVVDGVLVGRAGLGARLGYGRGGRQRGPWLLAAVLDRHHHSRRVPWSALSRRDDGRLQVRQLDLIEELEGRPA